MSLTLTLQYNPAAGNRNAAVTKLRKRIAGQLSAPYCVEASGVNDNEISGLVVGQTL